MPCSREGIRKLGIAFLITNILLIGIGTGFIIAGTLSVIEVPSLESDNTKPLLDPVLSDPFQAGGMAFGLSILIITIGVVILGVAGLGIFLISGKWFQIKRMLAIYAGFVGVVIICQIIFIIFWCGLLVNDKVEEELKDKLTVALKENFIEDTTSNIDSISNAWNYMFMQTAAVIIAIVIYLCFGDNETEGYRDKCCGIFFGDITMQIQGDLPLQRQRDVTVEKGGVRLGITNVDG